MRSQDEINKEILALRSLQPTGMFHNTTQKRIDLAIEELEHGVDTTAGEWGELSGSEQDAVLFARMWKEGDSDERPSVGWGDLVK